MSSVNQLNDQRGPLKEALKIIFGTEASVNNPKEAMGVFFHGLKRYIELLLKKLVSINLTTVRNIQ